MSLFDKLWSKEKEPDPASQEGTDLDPQAESDSAKILPTSGAELALPTKSSFFKRQLNSTTSPKTSMKNPSESESRTIIGKTVIVKGEVIGDEPLTIEGRVEGKISLNSSVLVKQTGLVRADITSHSITIEGAVSGNVEVTDKVEIVKGGTMIGDIKAPRVIVNDGANVKGRVEMEVKNESLQDDEDDQSNDLKGNGSSKISLIGRI